MPLNPIPPHAADAQRRRLPQSSGRARRRGARGKPIQRIWSSAVSPLLLPLPLNAGVARPLLVPPLLPPLVLLLVLAQMLNTRPSRPALVCSSAPAAAAQRCSQPHP